MKNLFKRETNLYVSQGDKPLGYMDLDDATLGKFARYFLITYQRAGLKIDAERGGRTPVTPFAGFASGLSLIRAVVEAESSKGVVNVDGYSIAGVEHGNWRITVERIDQP